jgi:hypothetical protein
VDIQPTGDMFMLVWRDGGFRGRFDVGTVIEHDPASPLIEKTIGVMEADDIATYLDLSIDTNTQTIPQIL